MFNKKNERRFVNISILFLILGSIGLLVTFAICSENNIDLSNNIIFDIVSKIIISIPICLLILYYVFIKPIYLQIESSKIVNMISRKQYEELYLLAQTLININPNITTRSIYCISLLFQKEYDKFFNYYNENKKYMNAYAVMHYAVAKFIIEDNIDNMILNKAKVFSKLSFNNKICKLIEKISLVLHKDYENALKISINKEINNNELFLYAFILCEIKAKQMLNLDFKTEIEQLDILYFK